jgi:hypothetical protein
MPMAAVEEACCYLVEVCLDIAGPCWGMKRTKAALKLRSLD